MEAQAARSSPIRPAPQPAAGPARAHVTPASAAPLRFLIAIATLLLLDALWLGLLMGDFYRDGLAHLARMSNGRLDPIWPVAALVYPALAGGLVVFVVQRARTPREALGLGAFFGLVTFGVYDFTNHAVLRDWRPLMTAVDVTWGTFLCATTAWVTASLTRRA